MREFVGWRKRRGATSVCLVVAVMQRRAAGKEESTSQVPASCLLPKDQTGATTRTVARAASSTPLRGPCHLCDDLVKCADWNGLHLMGQTRQMTTRHISVLYSAGALGLIRHHRCGIAYLSRSSTAAGAREPNAASARICAI
jgi:hypothetical protein